VTVQRDHDDREAPRCLDLQLTQISHAEAPCRANVKDARCRLRKSPALQTGRLSGPSQPGEGGKDGDYETLQALQRHRHAVAHELVTYVADPHAEVDVDLVRAVAEIIRRLGVFWARISMDADEVYDGVEVADEDIQSGPSIFVDFLLGALDEVEQA
jgi:hypothetical protein